MTEKEYKEKLDVYLKENGPNPGTTFFWFVGLVCNDEK